MGLHSRGTRGFRQSRNARVRTVEERQGLHRTRGSRNAWIYTVEERVDLQSRNAWVFTQSRNARVSRGTREERG